MSRSRTAGIRFAGIQSWGAAVLLALAWHALWLPAPRPRAINGVPAGPPPSLLLLTLGGADRTLLTPIFFSLDPGRTDSRATKDEPASRPPIDAIQVEPASLPPALLPPSNALPLPQYGSRSGSLMEALDRPPVVEPPDTDLGTWSIETDPATGWKVGDLLQSPLPDRPRLEGDGEIHVGLEFGPEGIPVTILLDSSSSAPEILDCLRTFIARWRIRPDLAPCSGTVHLRPPLPIGEEAP